MRLNCHKNGKCTNNAVSRQLKSLSLAAPTHRVGQYMSSLQSDGRSICEYLSGNAVVYNVRAQGRFCLDPNGVSLVSRLTGK